MKQEIKERVEKIRRGEVPGGYKETKVGIIPDDWIVKELSKIADVRDGTHESPKYVNEGIPFITSKNLLGTEIDWQTINYITKKDHLNFSKRSKVDDGDILFGMIGTIGNPTLVKMDFEFSIKNMALIKFRDSEINNKYLLNILKSFIINKQFHQQSNSAVQQFIALGTIRNLKIPLCDNKEQQKIAEILSTWDKAIELKEKLIEEEKKLRIATVNDLLFGLKRFDDFIKSHKYTPTKYINIPEDWEFIKIGDIATEVSEKNGNHEELPVLSCTKHSGLVDSLTYFKKRVFSEDTSTYKQVKKNQFVYATNHIDEGSIGCQNIYENSLVSPMYTVFKTNSKVNNDFLFSLLKTRLYIFIYQVNMSASVDRRGSLRWNDFSKIRIPLPDIAEQNKIVEFIRSVDNEIELLKLELKQFKEQKRGLMQLLLTGIVRVEVD